MNTIYQNMENNLLGMGGNERIDSEKCRRESMTTIYQLWRINLLDIEGNERIDSKKMQERIREYDLLDMENSERNESRRIYCNRFEDD